MRSLIVILFIVKSFAEFIGPGDLTLLRLEKCDEDLLDFKCKLIMKKFNRTHMGISASLKIPFPIDDKVAVNLTASKRGDGGWKPNALDVYEDDFCKFFEKVAKKQWFGVMAAINEPQRCPLNKGNYELTNFLFEPTVTIPIIYGEFMGYVRLIKDGVAFCCFKFYINAEPPKMKFG